MKTAQIDVIDVQKTKDGYIVKYWDENFDGENNVEMQISEEALLNFIINQEYNLVEYTNYSISGLECDGLDLKTIDPLEYLTNNRDEIIKDYIQANS